MNEYKQRIIDEEIKFRLKVFDAILISGQKECGKTRSAKQISKSYIEFQDEDKRDNGVLVIPIGCLKD